MQTTRNSSVANAAPSRNIHIFFIVHSPLMAFMPFCLSIITILLDSLLVLPYKKGCFDYFRFSLQVTMQKPPRLPVTETGAVRLLYLCFFKRSRNYLRGFLIAAWAGAKITERSEQQYEIQELLFSPFAIAST